MTNCQNMSTIIFFSIYVVYHVVTTFNVASYFKVLKSKKYNCERNVTAILMVLNQITCKRAIVPILMPLLIHLPVELARLDRRRVETRTFSGAAFHIMYSIVSVRMFVS